MSKGDKGRGRLAWSAADIMHGLAEKVERELRVARYSIGHAPTMGEATQAGVAAGV